MGTFKGNLLHGLKVAVNIPKVDSLTATRVIQTDEIAIYPQGFFAMCKNKLPVLKNINMKIAVVDGETVQVSDDGGISIISNLFNLDEEQLPADDLDGDVYFEHICGATFSLMDGQDGASVTPVLKSESGNKKFSPDGMLLRPDIGLLTVIENVNAGTLDADSLQAIIELDIDWVDVSEKEFNEYLQELWLLGAVND